MTEEKTPGQLASEEIAEILKKYECTLICRQVKIYGQVIWEPIVDELQKQKTNGLVKA